MFVENGPVPMSGPGGPGASRAVLRAFFAFFIVSGFCSLVYEVVWLRLAMAQFGVTTPTVSIVLSVFMAGLAVGSWGAGLLARRLSNRPAATLVRVYAAAELAIAISGVIVPPALSYGRLLLGAMTGGAEWGSSAYYLASGAWIALALLPFCCCMGATFPLAIGALRRLAPAGSSSSFSYLYVANVLGATLGTVTSAFCLIELFGFRGTLALTAAFNLALAVCILAASRRWAARVDGAGTAPAPAEPAGTRVGRAVLVALFMTGFMSMAMEVIWVRQFTPYLGNVVYAFASILALYLVATFAGSRLYRSWIRHADVGSMGARGAVFFSALGVLGVLPLIFADYRLPLAAGLAGGMLRLAPGIGPLCAALGFVTPLLVDRWSSGDPQRVGSAYATNVVGCILGPLAAGFLLLPALGERWALLGLAALAPLVGLLLARSSPPLRTRSVAPVSAVVAVALSLAVLVVTADYGRGLPGAVVRRDSTATVIAWGRGRDRRLFVNGCGMTSLTPITKMMAHLPLAMGRTPPTKALTICFGMGTSFRSVLSWGIRSDAVELVPSVPALFGYFHNDGPQLLLSPRARVVIDDGRRFLERSSELYDVIIVDPPPPTEAAGSSLLYSREFYETAKRHLLPGGVLQQWSPGREASVAVAFTRAIREAFPYVRAFVSMEGWGLHLLASSRPIPSLTASALAGRLPPAAVDDLVEWGPASTAEGQFRLVLSREVPVDVLIRTAPGVAALEDDRPVNEYYLLRRKFGL